MQVNATHNLKLTTLHLLQEYRKYSIKPPGGGGLIISSMFEEWLIRGGELIESFKDGLVTCGFKAVYSKQPEDYINSSRRTRTQSSEAQAHEIGGLAAEDQ